MNKVFSWEITGLFQNYRYFFIYIVAVRTGTIVIVPVRYLSLRTLLLVDLRFKIINYYINIFTSVTNKLTMLGEARVI